MSEHPSVDNAPLRISGEWTDVFSARFRGALENKLAAYLRNQRWFGGKAREIQAVSFKEIIRADFQSRTAVITQIEAAYAEAESEMYTLPLVFAAAQAAERIYDSSPNAVLVRLVVDGNDGETSGCLFDAVLDDDFCKSLVDMIANRRALKGSTGELAALPTSALPDGQPGWVFDLEVASLRTEQTNSSIVFSDKWILKLFRRTEPGINPDLEVGRFLTERVGFASTPRIAGSIEYRPRGGGGAAAIAILQAFVPNQGDAWRQTLAAVRGFFERAVTQPAEAMMELQRATGPLEHLQRAALPRHAESLLGTYLASIQLLGQRTAELHVALASCPDDPEFKPEPFSMEYQESLYRAVKEHSERMFQLLESNLKTLQGPELDGGSKVLGLRSETANRFRALLSRRLSAQRTRVHGDYHLGQVLFTGTDYFIIDFEGEPARPLEERRAKCSPVRDVVGMLRSYHYAAYASLFGPGSGSIPGADIAALEPWARMWSAWACSAFLNSYLDHAEPGRFLPGDPAELDILLNVYLLEKALYELGYELNNRPDWVRIPLNGLLQLLQSPEQAA